MALQRVTLPTLLVLQSLLGSSGEETYGLQIKHVTGLPSGTIYPILARLERAGWVSSHWEDVAQVLAGRPRRRYYQLAPEHVDEAKDLLKRRSRASGRIS